MKKKSKKEIKCNNCGHKLKWNPKKLDFEEAVKILLNAAELNYKREGLKETPRRVWRAYREMFKGYDSQPEMKTFSNSGYDEMIVLKDVPFYSMCEHHVLPFFGVVHLAYVPNKKLLGVSKLARIMDKYAQRLQIQERMTTQIAGDIMKIKPKGCGVIIEGQHLCMMARGVKKPGSTMVTSCLKGCFKEKSCREEFLRLCGK